MKNVFLFIIGGLLFVAGYDCIRRQAKLTAVPSIYSVKPTEEIADPSPEAATKIVYSIENQFVSN